MSSFTVTVKDDGVQAMLQTLLKRTQNLTPALTALGDEIVERTKHRFDTSSGPDGAAWKSHSVATLAMVSGALGKGFRKKDGSLNARGTKKMAGKKLLVDSGFLRTNIFPSIAGNTLTIGATAQYAAIHQFGGQRCRCS